MITVMDAKPMDQVGFRDDVKRQSPVIPEPDTGKAAPPRAKGPPPRPKGRYS